MCSVGSVVCSSNRKGEKVESSLLVTGRKSRYMYHIGTAVNRPCGGLSNFGD